MIRFPNAKSDPIEIRKIYQVAVCKLPEDVKYSINGISHDQLSHNVAVAGGVSSSGQIGTAALAASYATTDRSRNSIFNQMKMLSEVYRLLGWLRPLPGNRGQFWPTPIGEQFCAFRGDSFDIIDESLLGNEIELWQHNLLNVVFPHPHVVGSKGHAQRPFSLILRVAEQLAFITRDELIFSVFQETDDRSATAVSSIVEQVLSWRQQNGSVKFQAVQRACLQKTHNNLSTMQNYTRLPLSMLKALRWFDKRSYAELPEAIQQDYRNELGDKARQTTFLELSPTGRSISQMLSRQIDLRASDLSGNDSESLSAICVLLWAAKKGVVADEMLVQLLAPGALALLNSGVTVRLVAGQPIANDPVLFEPFQQFDTDVLEGAINLCRDHTSLMHLFDPVSHQMTETSWRFPSEPNLWPPKQIDRSINAPGKWQFENDRTSQAVCMKCHPAPCTTFLDEEVQLPERWRNNGIPDAKTHQVCPTHAITIGSTGLPVIEQDLCIYCHLCLVRCPVGALYWQDELLMLASQQQTIITETTGTGQEAQSSTLTWKTPLLSRTVQIWDIPGKSVPQLIHLFHQAVENKNSILGNKEAYYPLVRNLLRQLDLMAVLGRTGDTAFRLDAIVLDPFVMTLEIKSPSENTRLSPGSIRQAVENAAIVINRYRFATNPINIVVGHKPPRDRSDVSKALGDIKEALKLGIGVFTTGTLLYLFLRHQIYHFHPTLDLESLFRATVGVCDDSTLHEFWANYFKRRLQLLALDSKYNLVDELKTHLPNAFQTATLTSDELMQLWQDESLTVILITGELIS